MPLDIGYGQLPSGRYTALVRHYTHIHLLIITNERPSRIRVRDNLIYTGTLHQHHRHRRYHTDR